MSRSVFVGLIAILFCSFQTGCCCCSDFMKGFNKGFQQGLQKAQKQAEEEERRAQKAKEDEAKQVIAQNLGPNDRAGLLAANSPFWNQLRPKIAKKGFQATELIGPGARNDPTFTDTGPEPGVLIGVFACDQQDGGVVSYLQPIFLTAQGEKTGQAYGKLSTRPVHVLKAKSGYAVGGIKLRHGGAIDQVQLVFMRVDGEKLNPADQQLSAKVGVEGAVPLQVLSTGPLVVGLGGTRGQEGGFSPPGTPSSLSLLTLQQ
jgi:hypothetical protein